MGIAAMLLLSAVAALAGPPHPAPQSVIVAVPGAATIIEAPLRIPLGVHTVQAIWTAVIMPLPARSRPCIVHVAGWVEDTTVGPSMRIAESDTGTWPPQPRALHRGGSWHRIGYTGFSPVFYVGPVVMRFTLRVEASPELDGCPQVLVGKRARWGLGAAEQTGETALTLLVHRQ